MKLDDFTEFVTTAGTRISYCYDKDGKNVVGIFIEDTIKEWGLSLPLHEVDLVAEIMVHLAARVPK